MKFKIFAIFVISSVTVFGFDCDESKCDPIPPKHYEELGCEPIKKVGECCPTSFDCKHLEARDEKKCYLKGKTFSHGDNVDDLLLRGSCEGACRCENKRIVCEHKNCDENFGPRPEPGCVRQYALDKCCSIGTVCDEAAKKLATCEFEGKTYKDGERMHSEDFKCHKCICSKSFENKPVPENKNCVKIDCNIELFELESVKRGCIPMYHKDSCCPYDWRCPESDDAIIPADQEHKSDSSSPKCKFGKLLLEVGDSLSRSEGGCSKCSCRVPPFADCIFTSC